MQTWCDTNAIWVLIGWTDYRWYLGCSWTCCPSSCCCPDVASESCCCCCSCMRCCRLRALLMQRCSRLWLLPPPSAATSCSLAAARSHVNRKYTTERKETRINKEKRKERCKKITCMMTSCKNSKKQIYTRQKIKYHTPDIMMCVCVCVWECVCVRESVCVCGMIDNSGLALNDEMVKLYSDRTFS